MDHWPTTSETTKNALKALLSDDERFVSSIGVFSLALGDDYSSVSNYQFLALSHKVLRVVTIAHEFGLTPRGEFYLAKKLARGNSAEFARFCAEEKYRTSLYYSDKIKDIKVIDLKDISDVTWSEEACPLSVTDYFQLNCKFSPDYYATVAMTTSSGPLVFGSIDPGLEEFCDELDARVGRWWHRYWLLARRWRKRTP